MLHMVMCCKCNTSPFTVKSMIRDWTLSSLCAQVFFFTCKRHKIFLQKMHVEGILFIIFNCSLVFMLCTDGFFSYNLQTIISSMLIVKSAFAYLYFCTVFSYLSLLLHLFKYISCLLHDLLLLLQMPFLCPLDGTIVQQNQNVTGKLLPWV